MPISVVWTQDGNPLATWTLTDTILSSLEKYRQSFTSFPPMMVDGTLRAVPTPKWTTIQEMVVAIFYENLVSPAFKAFPPEEVVVASQAVAVAQAALIAAQAAVAAALLTITAPPA